MFAVHSSAGQAGIWAQPSFLYVRVFNQTAVKVSIRASVTLQGSTGEGSTSKLRWLLIEMSSLWTVGQIHSASY